MTPNGPLLGRLGAAVRAYPWRELPHLPGRTNHKRAGVLVPLRLGDDPELLLILRAQSLREHPGEVGFPGGKPEDSDTDLQHTALREAREELGIRGAIVLGRLSSVPVYTSDYRLEPTVAIIPNTPLKADPGEVAAVLPISLRAIAAAPHLHGIPWTWDGVDRLSPTFDTAGHVIFGATAHVLHEALQVLMPVFGLTIPPLIPGPRTWADLLPR